MCDLKLFPPLKAPVWIAFKPDQTRPIRVLWGQRGGATGLSCENNIGSFWMWKKGLDKHPITVLDYSFQVSLFHAACFPYSLLYLNINVEFTVGSFPWRPEVCRTKGPLTVVPAPVKLRQYIQLFVQTKRKRSTNREASCCCATSKEDIISPPPLLLFIAIPAVRRLLLHWDSFQREEQYSDASCFVF